MSTAPVSWDDLASAWSPADVDAPTLWADSGAQWLTAEGVDVPVDLVRAVAGAVGYLDDRGAGLAAVTGASGVGTLAERAAYLALGPSGTVSCGGASRLVRGIDGWIAVSLARPDDVASIPAWLDTDVAGEPWTVVADRVASLECREVVARGVVLGIACSVVGEVDDRRPVLVAPLGDAPARSVDGAVVVNLASLWAGPLAADALARLGARVIDVESTARPDGARHTPAFFDALHGRSESVALPLHTERGRRQLRVLLGAADVVIEGSRPRALEQFGIDAAELVRRGPKVWLSITGHGRAGPRGLRVGFGDDAAAAGGLVGRVDGDPRFVADAVADPLTGLTAAATAVQLLEAPGRFLADVALSRVAASVAAGEWTPVNASAPVRRPRIRTEAGRAQPLGRDTAAVQAEFGIG